MNRTLILYNASRICMQEYIRLFMNKPIALNKLDNPINYELFVKNKRKTVLSHS